ncbi:MAG TPA: dihydrolipoyl dehydrogenase [Planctomycetota bacterium]|nr:dihydrolipoyl dehydrogenase [Planctomycetota bacterium]
MPRHDLVIIGAGPGGYMAALRAAQLGLDVACIEKEPRLGGTCLRIGCIPSKALLESSDLYHEAKTRFANHGIVLKSVELDLAQMHKRKDETVDGLTRGVAGLFKKNKVARYEGSAKLLGPGSVSVATAQGELSLECKHVILATGSLSSELKGVELDLDRIGTSTEALAWTTVPKHLVVIGAGVIGLELGSVWARLGAKVTVLEYLDRILPGMDSELAKEAQRCFEKQGITFLLKSRVTGARATKKSAIVSAGGREPIECDRVLLAVGRRPNTEGLGLEATGVALDKRGVVIVDERFATNLPGVFAIGDLIRGPMLAHKAEEEGVACVERIVTGHGHVNYNAIPNVVYTAPEIASVGSTEEELTQAAVPYRKGFFPFQANARAKALGHTEGRVKILAHRDTDRVLGVHILGPRAGDLIAECTAAIEFGASSEDIARTCHAHPTLAEAVKEAALAVDGRALNI